MLAEKGLGFAPWLTALTMSHIHLLLVGWMVQLACGVAVWILPRLDAAGSRGDLRLVWLCYAALNGGIVLAALYGPLLSIGVAGGWMPALGGALYGLAAATFVAHVWRRVAPFRALPRPSQATEDDARRH
jgi:hypothetical protein